MDLFSYEKPIYKLPPTVRLFEAFSGIGTQAMALKRLTNVQHIGFSEIDKYAISAYKAIHGDVPNYGDITKMIEIPPCDVFTWSFPCTDLSKAGKQKGLQGTRSGLGFEVIRLLHATKDKPKVLLMENVPDLLSPKFREGWHEMYNEIESLGYINYVEVLNAKNYGVAQNRERVFMISILGDYTYSFPKPFELTTRLLDYLEEEVEESYFLSSEQIKRINESTYHQNVRRIHDPKGIVSTLCARDFKDPKCVDLSEYSVKSIEKIKKNIVDVNGVANTITANPQRATIDSWTLIQIGQIYGTEKEPNPQVGRVYDQNGISPTLDSMQGGNRMQKIIIPEKTKKGYAEAEEGDGVYTNRPHQKRGVVQKGMIQTIKANPSDIGVVVRTKEDNELTSNDLMIDENGNVKRYINSDIVDEFNPGDSADLSFPNGYNKANRVYKGYAPSLTVTTTKNIVAKLPTLRIRKLTPLECFRLMGCDDIDYYKSAYGDNYTTGMKIMECDQSFENKLFHIKKIPQINSNSQLYKMAGNAIVVNVLVSIFKEMI